jgi:uncharacterized protein YutE (UPF0331/DUF86 family)
MDTRRHLETLQVACTRFGDNFDESAFARAWNGTDEEMRLAAYAVQAGYENSINGAMKIAQELSELAGWTPANTEPSVFEALKALKANGIVDNKTLTGLRGAYEDRGILQHDYVNAGVAEIHAATLDTLEAVPSLLQDVELYLRQNDLQ